MIIRDINDGKFGFRLILVDDLNPEDAAMVQALLARMTEEPEAILERIYASRRAAFTQALDGWCAPMNAVRHSYELVGALLVDLMAISSHNDASALARRVCNDYFANYNHKSIADCAFTTVIVKGVSMLAAKALEHHPLFAGQETSTRAVDMTKVKLVDPIGTPESRAVHQKLMDFYASSWAATADEVRQRYPKRADEDEKKYEAAVKARTFDVLRAWIPAGASTNLSLTMNLRQIGDHLTDLLLHPLAEVRAIATAIQAMLRERYPSSGPFGGAAGVSGVGKDGREDERSWWRERVGSHFGMAYQGPRWVSEDASTDDMDRAGYEDTIDLIEIESSCHADVLLRQRPRGCELPRWMGDLGQVTCNFFLDFGSFRDIERQRSLYVRMPKLNTRLGFEQWYFDQLPESLRGEAAELLDYIASAVVATERMKDAYVRHDYQYLVPMGYKVPVSLTGGLPAFAYVVELRSGATVHPTLRRAVLKHMVEPFRRAHPEVLLHVDETEDPWNLRRGQQTITRKEST